MKVRHTFYLTPLVIIIFICNIGNNLLRILCFPDLSNWRVITTSSHQFSLQPTPLRKVKPLTVIILFCVSLVFQPNLKNMIFRHSTAYRSHINDLVNIIILLGLSNAQRHLYSIICGPKPSFIVIRATIMIVLIRC